MSGRAGQEITSKNGIRNSSRTGMDLDKGILGNRDHHNDIVNTGEKSITMCCKTYEERRSLHP